MTAHWRRQGNLDAMLYGAAVLFALSVSLVAAVPQFRSWGRIAVGPYAAGAVVALLLARAG
ncbi:MAG TPA: hypothetical protein VF972_07460, partial [Actinomycetota bacterium]